MFCYPERVKRKTQKVGKSKLYDKIIIMESTNDLHHQHHHHLQDQLDVGTSSSLSTTVPSWYGVGSNSHAWTPNINTLNNAGNNIFNSNFIQVIPNSRVSSHKDDIQVSPLDNAMIQDLGYQWATSSNGGSCLTRSQSTHDHDHHLQISKIKDEISGAFPKFTEMLNTDSTPSSTVIEDYSFPPSRQTKDEHKDLNIDLSEKLLLKTLSTREFYSNPHQNCQSLIGGVVGIPSRGNFSQIYPSVKISNLNNDHQSSSSPISSSLDMNLQALDPLTSSRFSGSFGHCSHDHVLGRHTDRQSLPFVLDHHMHHSIINDRSSCSPSNVSHFTNIGGMADQAKRPSTLMKPKACQSQSAPKKSRLESHTPCPPIKVRKEKLGDRIAALQQLVAPFGKTDTASVLMEATGYIKFLQHQVETLSVPYMKSAGNQSIRVIQGGSTIEDENERDLRSRGLCLVPLSCMSYVIGDVAGGGGAWPPPNLARGT
ncbi:putative Transcription factor [Quillaja saponaria]|uniref:Transcription factor n=1 Tax=Quillaja saponaria TaxID=32244 RepID=A0AAD7LGK8_QUISA|nr:putative Transcription factor [Quillaja saponaria]